MFVPLRILLTGFVLLIPCFGRAQDKPSNDDSPTVAELVEQLNSLKREVRDSAERKLIDRGPAILGQLPEYDAVKSPEVRSALFRIRQELENENIELSLRSTTLRFPDQDLTLAEAVKLIREKTGNDLRLSESLVIPEDPIRFAQEEFTFWQSVIQLIEKYQLDLEVDESISSKHFTIF